MLVLALVTALVGAGSAFAASYWFYQGTLSGSTFNKPQDASTDWARMSFDNTTPHKQNIIVIDRSGNWHAVGVSCSGGTGCDSGDLGFSSYTYPTGGCQNPTSNAPAYTNCKYNDLYP